jgi:hypothetical protein
MQTTETATEPTTETPEVEVLPPETFQISTGQDDGYCGFTININGTVELDEDQTPEQYVKGLQFFKTGLTKFKLTFSDYVAKGRKKHGVQCVENGLEQLEFDMPTVQMALDIATIPEEMRYPNLTEAHYIVLARASHLTPAKRARWAKIASEQNLTAAELKKAINKGETGGGSDDSKSGVMSIHGIHVEFDVWLRRVKGVKGILKMRPEEIDEILEELAPFVGLHSAIIAGRNQPKKTRKTKKA